MLFIGITGGVGSGKSTVLDYLSDNYNCIILKADEIANSLKLPGNICYEQLVELLGNSILTDGYIDNKKMAEVIFADSSLLNKVNDIIHPKVKQFILDKLACYRAEGKIDCIFLEAALLIETGYKELLDELWLVDTSDEERIKRLAKSRGYSVQKTQNIIQSQLSNKAYRENSDFIIDNSGDFESVTIQIAKRLEEKNVRKLK